MATDPKTTPTPTTRVRSKTTGLTGTVGPYGWTDRHGVWQHGPYFPVRWDNRVWSLASSDDIEELPTKKPQPPASEPPR